MNNKRMEFILDTVEKHNHPKIRWSFLTSIEYMLESHLYADGLLSDCELVEKTLNNPNARILDFGTGSGIFAVLLSKKHKNVYAVDTVDNKSQCDPRFENATEQQAAIWKDLGKEYGIKFQHYDGLCLPYPDNYFDAISTYAVIEHVEPEDLPQVMGELRRILKDGAPMFVFKFPRTLSYTEHLSKFFGMGGHDILYGDGEGKTLFTNYGFNVVKNWKSVMFFEYPGSFTNMLYSPLKFLDNALSHSPLNVFSHHNNYILTNSKSHKPIEKEVLMIAPTFLPIVGGTETHVKDLANFMGEQGLKVNLISCTNFNSKEKTEEHRENIFIKRIPCVASWMNGAFAQSSLFYFFYLFPLLFWHSFLFMLKNHRKIGMIHVHAFTAALSGVLLKLIFRDQKLVLSVHGIYFSKNPKHLRYNKYAGYIRFVSGFYDKILALGRRSKAELIKVGISPEKIVSYKYWIDEGLFKPVTRKPKTGKLNVFFVGRLVEAKGVDILLEAAKDLPGINFRFAGEGYLEPKVKQYSEKYDNITLLGRLGQRELPKYYSGSDLTLMLSQNDGEGLPRVLIESLFCGTPVMSTDCGGAKEIVDPSVGFIVERDKQSLINRLSHYSTDKKLQKKLESNCTLFAKSNFSINQADVILKCYKEMLQS